MECIACKRAEPRGGTATERLERGGTTLFVRSIPAEVCPACGAAYFDEATTARLLQLVREAELAGVGLGAREYAAA
jgi:YgiT-type zinc finger domain-containing protein